MVRPIVKSVSKSFEELFPMSEKDHSKRIWRYMSIYKFVSMLRRKELYFSSAEKFRKDDSFEGAIPLAWIKWEQEETNLLEQEGAPPTLGPTKATREAVRKEGPWMFVNCWNMGEYESLAMWNLYAKDGASVCIRSTYGLLKDSLQDTLLHFGKIRYIDHSRDDYAVGSVFAPYMHKRHAFSHEKELRVLWYDRTHGYTKAGSRRKLPAKSHSISVNLSSLIEKVVVRPTVERWIQDINIELLKAITEKYGLHVPVERSEIDVDPIYA